MGRSPLFVKWSLSLKGWKQSSVQQAHMISVFVIQNIMHFLKRNLKQGSSYPPLFSFAFTCPTLDYFLKNHSKDCEERLWYLTLLESRPSTVLQSCLQIITVNWMNWMGTKASPKRYFFFFFKNNYTNFKSISPPTIPIQTKRGGVAFEWEFLCH